MRTRKEIVASLREGNDIAEESEKESDANLMRIATFGAHAVELLLDIRDIVDGLDKRMGAASIKKVAKKIK